MHAVGMEQHGSVVPGAGSGSNVDGGHLLGDEPALGHQLGVALVHDAARHAAVDGERAGGRQAIAGYQTSGAHGLPEHAG